MSYREHAPPAALEPWLECIWERRGGARAPVRVLPDGCIDIVVMEGAGAQIVGANTTAFVVPVDGRTRIVGARMLPGAAPALYGIAAEEVRDVRAPVSELLADGARLELELAWRTIPWTRCAPSCSRAPPPRRGRILSCARPRRGSSDRASRSPASPPTSASASGS